MTVRRPFPRAFVLIAVVVVTAILLLATMAMVSRGTAHRVASDGAAQRLQHRLNAWSAVQAVMSRLDGSRSFILEGGSPIPPESELVLWTVGGEDTVARLLPIGPGGDRIVPEAGRLDLQTVDAEGLVATGLVDPDVAQAIVAERGRRPGGRFRSVYELLDVPGIDPELVVGPLDELRVRDAAMGDGDDLADRVAARLDREGAAGAARRLLDLLTVHAVEPAIQRSGVGRIRLNVAWSDELGQRLDERFGEGTGQVVQGLLENGRTFDTESSIVQTLIDFDVDGERWPDIIDGLTSESGEEHHGRLDLNRASTTALMGLPGMTLEVAEAIVDRRDGLSADDRATIAWPVAEGIMPPELLAELADRLTARSWLWRVRIAAGTRSVDAIESSAIDIGGATSQVGGGRLRDVVIFDAVLDLSFTPPRLAALRDVSHLQLAAELLDGLDLGWDGGGGGDGFAAAGDMDGADDGLPADDPLGGGGDGDDGVGSSFGGFGSSFGVGPDGDEDGGADPASEFDGSPMSPTEGDAAPMSPAADRPAGSSSAPGPSRRRHSRWLGPDTLGRAWHHGAILPSWSRDVRPNGRPAAPVPETPWRAA